MANELSQSLVSIHVLQEINRMEYYCGIFRFIYKYKDSCVRIGFTLNWFRILDQTTQLSQCNSCCHWKRWFSPHFCLPVPSSHMVLVWLLNPVLNSFLPGRDQAILSALMVWNRCRELCASFLARMFQREGCRSGEKPPVPRGVWARSAWVPFYLRFGSRKWVVWFYIYLLWYIVRCYHLHMI